MDHDALPEHPGFVDTSVPAEYRGHAEFQKGPYFTLPHPLLDALCRKVGRDRFDSDLLEMEYALSRVSGNHASRIGFWRNVPISFLLLETASDPVDSFVVEKFARMMGKSEQVVREQITTLDQRMDWATTVRRGYCGWLLTNPRFLEEHRQIVARWSVEIEKQGIPIMGPVVQGDPSMIGDCRVAEGSIAQLLRDFEDFFVRWRLEGMPAPLVPMPMGIHFPVCDLRSVLGHMCAGGKSFFLPDIYPVPSRDELRQAIEDALRQIGVPEHLGEWHAVVHSDNVAKNQIDRYARVFVLQHYVRALYARHEAALDRKKSAIILAMAEYLEVSDDTIERDLAFIVGRLGADWHLASA